VALSQLTGHLTKSKDSRESLRAMRFAQELRGKPQTIRPADQVNSNGVALQTINMFEKGNCHIHRFVYPHLQPAFGSLHTISHCGSV